MDSFCHLQQPKMERKLLQKKKGKKKGRVHTITHNNHNGERAKCSKKNQHYIKMHPSSLWVSLDFE
jgi:hypothetical protein